MIDGVTPVLLEVEVAHERDVPGAVGGGADRLVVAGTPSTAVVSSVCHGADLPVFVELPAGAGAVDYAREALACGAAGVAFGLLDADLEVDLVGCATLLASLPGVSWTFTRVVDDALEPLRSWRRLAAGRRDGMLPGLVGVCSAGSPRGMAEGQEDLLAAVETDPAVAALLVAGGGLLSEQVPWLVRAGVRSFRIEAQARPGGSARAYVDAGLVRSWRTLLDSALDRI